MHTKPPEPVTEELLSADSKIEKSCLDVYERLVEYFDKEEPYLNMDLNINDVARTLLTNKVYISKAVNMFSHRNFCQFVNLYRIKYALKVFEEDPNVKLNDLSRMSGFRTVATFNMAFKLHLNQSPGEWSRQRRMMLKSSYKF
ncbi:MAG: helix-turn-helix domain-containing protein [Candidatus Cryptobacteroides sp.]